MKDSSRKLILLVVLFSILVFSTSAFAQNNDITNEYRVTLVTSKPINKKLVLFTYLGVVKAPDKSVGTLYYSPPGIIYKPKPWIELWAGAFGLYNNNKNTSNSWEILDD